MTAVERKMAKAPTTLLFWIATLALAGTGHAQPSSRSGTAAALFDRYCLSSSPEFARLDRDASANHYQVFLDRSVPLGKDGQLLRQKHWLDPTLGGTLLLTAEDTANGPLHVFGCGVMVNDGDAADLERIFSENPRLGTPAKRVEGAAATSSTVTWLARVGDAAPSEDAQVLMAAHMPGLAGVMINLIYRTHLNR